METVQAAEPSLLPLAVYGTAAVAVIAAMLLLSYFLGQRHRERATGEPYESGVAATGTTQVRLNVQFYLVAVFVLIFDLEAAFLYAWAVAVRESGWVFSSSWTSSLMWLGCVLGGKFSRTSVSNVTKPTASCCFCNRNARQAAAVAA